MIEIVCPSCGAQYQVPDDSIGPEGRKVTCSNCSHKWRAYREVAGAEAGASTAAGAAMERPSPATAPETTEPRPEESRPEESRPEERHAEETAAQDASSREGAAAASPEEMPPGQPPRAGGREEQMDAIRRMLDDLKRNSEDEPGPETEPAAKKQTARPEPTKRRYTDDDDLEDTGVDPLKSRIAQMDKSAKAERPSNYDAAKLRRMHEKRAKRLQRAKERQKKSGAFVTGFTLVAVVTAAMVSLYVLHPKIIASQPQMAPAMNEYVGTVDRYRIALDQATADWQVWIRETVGPMLGGEEQAQETQAEAGAASATAEQ